MVQSIFRYLELVSVMDAQTDRWEDILIANATLHYVARPMTINCPLVCHSAPRFNNLQFTCSPKLA